MNPLQMLHFTERVSSYFNFQLMAKFPEISEKVKDFKNIDAVLNCMAEWLAAQQTQVSAKTRGVLLHESKSLASQKPSMPLESGKRS